MAAEITLVAAMARNTIGHGLPAMSRTAANNRAWAPA